MIFDSVTSINFDADMRTISANEKEVKRYERRKNSYKGEYSIRE